MNRGGQVWGRPLVWLNRISARHATLFALRATALLMALALVAPVYAAGRQNVQVVWSNDAPLGGYQLGDFNGDSRTDLFRVNGSQWQ
jgi:hypothetical protein